MAVILTGQMIKYMFGNIGLEKVLILVNLEQTVSEFNAKTQVWIPGLGILQFIPSLQIAVIENVGCLFIISPFIEVGF